MNASLWGFSIVLGTCLVVVDAQASGPSGRDVMVKYAEASGVSHIVSSSTLVIGTAKGETRSKSFSLWRKAASDGVHYRTLTRFTAPAEISGEGVLLDEKVNGQNEVLLYLPRYKKVRRVESQAQRSSFMGSSFSYADMTTQAVDDYRHDLGKSEPCPGDSKLQCFVVISTPVNETVKTNHGYSKKISWVRSTDFQAIRVDLFDVDGALWKRIAYTDIREVDPERHRSVPHFVRVEDVKLRRFSTVQVHSADVKTGVADGLFNEQSLSREI